MKNRYVLIADIVLVALAAFAAFTARFDFSFHERRPEFLPYLLVAILLKPAVFLLFGLYRRYWQYTSIQDVAVIVAAIATSSLGMTVFVMVGLSREWFYESSRVVVLNDLFITLVLVAGLRVVIRTVHESTTRKALARGIVNRRVLIAGAGAAGTMVAREMARNPQLGLFPIGFVDDDPNKRSKKMAGLAVLGSLQALPDIVRAFHVDEVVIAMPTAPGAKLREVLALCNEAGVKSQVIPGVFELLAGKVGVNRLRNVEISDLLRRNTADTTAPIDFVRGRAVLVTGAGGSIGSELVRQVANAAPACVVLMGHGENSIFDAQALVGAEFPAVRCEAIIADIRDRQRIGQIFARVRPAVVFHAAAHKHVPLMEDNPEEAITNNVVGTRNVVEAAIEHGVERLVQISTDKAVSPTSVMGASKRIAELIVQQAARRSGRAFVSVRFGNVLGSRDSVVNTFKKQIERGGPVTVTHPQMTRFFMTIPEAVHLVLQAGGLGTGGELFVLEMGEPVRIVDLAEDLIRLSGLSTDDVPIVFSGVRPGEKLHEALLEDGLRGVPTAVTDVLQVSGPAQAPEGDVDAVVLRLEVAAREGDRQAIFTELSRLIPSFRPGGQPR